MVISTYDGLEHVADLIQDSVDTIAIGTGGTTEAQTDSSLENEEYRASVGASNVSIVDLSGSGVLYQLNIKGGTQVAGGTQIQEIGLFADADGDGTTEILVVRDTFGIKEITSGRFSTFEIELPVENGA